MHSSISISEEIGLERSRPEPGQLSSHTGVIALLVGLAVIMLGFEVGSPLILQHLSRTERRVETELLAARSLRPVTADGRPTLLLAGNSLLLEGVQLDHLHDSLASQYEVSRLGIEQTQYLDWYFGLRRLLEEGARPSLIVLSLATDQLASTLTLGEEFAHRQMSTHDFPLAIQAIKLDQTTASTYLEQLAGRQFRHSRAGINSACAQFSPIGRTHRGSWSSCARFAVTAQQGTARLARVTGALADVWSEIVLLVPPTQREDHSREIQAMGEQTGLPVWVLSPPGEFSRDLYRDGFHLNDRGSEIFTSRLAEQIRKAELVKAGSSQ
jgi:hypothetical protein